MQDIVAKFNLNIAEVCHAAVDASNVYILAEQDKERLREIFSAIEYDATGGESYVSRMRQAAYSSFPQDIIDLLHQQKTGLLPRPYMVFANLPYDVVTGSPRQHESSLLYKPSALSENLNIAFASLIGEPYSIVFEGREIVNNLVPYRETAQHYTGLGSDVELSLHTENALLKYYSEGHISPDGLLLQGVRHDVAAPKTHIADGSRILSMLSEEDIHVLRQSRFLIKPPARWRDSLHMVSGLCPLLRGDVRCPDMSVAFYGDMVTPQDREAEDVFGRFYHAAKQASIWVDIHPGMMVYTDNRLAIHARDAFTAKYDQNGHAMRWVQRTFVRESLFNFRRFGNSSNRVFDPSTQRQRPTSSTKMATSSLLAQG